MKTLVLHLAALWLLAFSTAIAEVKPLVPGQAIENSIPEGEMQTYQVELDRGQFALITVEQMGIDIVVSVVDPNGEKISEVDAAGAEGTERIAIEAAISGSYQLRIVPFEYHGYEQTLNEKYKIRIAELLSAAEYKKRLETERLRHKATIQWLAENAIPLQGVEAEQGFEDMQPLKRIIGDAPLVALGEATHGTREFFQLKHRMLEFLVTEMDFNIFSIEATMPEGFDVNEYVLTGRGDPEKALAGLYFWTWNTEEVLEMIRWMRRYNADPDHTRKVKFYGFDMQFGVRALNVVEDYLNRVDRNAARTVSENSLLSLIRNPYTERDFADASAAEKPAASEVVSSMIELLDARKEDYIGLTGHNDWEIARLHATILVQWIQLMSEEQYTDYRDRSMANNIRWIMEHEGPDAKMVIWAHNGHVSFAESETYARMGRALRETYGEEYVVFGFRFGEGSFQARKTGDRDLRPFHVKPLPKESLDATLAAAGLPYAAIDLHELPETGPVAEWFAEPHETRGAGALFDPDALSGYSAMIQMTDRYDALLFVAETTAARPNPGGTRPRQRIHASPKNLDFESGDPGLIPEGWSAHKYMLANFDFTVETTTEDPQQGDKCVKISRPSGRHYGETFGSLMQRLDAAPYRGKRIKLRAAVRTDVEGPGNSAYLWLSAGTPPAFAAPDSHLFRDNMKDRPISTTEWRFFEIAGEVSGEAQWIDLGMALSGEGSAWFDSLTLETVEP